ncbi:MAG: radical SAM protein [Desulfobacteraceae bacterium]|nr:MAG: radical SAM protein [Desulfobacteraceae bacterium]
MKTALVTPLLSHLPFHPSSFLGYAAALLNKQCELDVIDLNAEIHFMNNARLNSVLDEVGMSSFVSDDLFLYPYYNELQARLDEAYRKVAWGKYGGVYVTTPSWFPTVPTDAVLRLARCIKEESPETELFFLSNSLGSWTDERELRKRGIGIVHLNGLSPERVGTPVDYDSLPVPLFERREKYLFDLLPFMLKHGCPWGKCRFCSLAKGSNSGCLERSAEAAFREIEELLERYRPRMLVCRDNAINGKNLRQFCALMRNTGIPWIAMSRADLSKTEIRLLGDSGCRLLYFGLESGSDRVLGKLRKGIGSKQMSLFLKSVFEQGIIPFPSLMVGTPDETEADFHETIRFLGEHSAFLEMVNIYPFMITPASDFHRTRRLPSATTTIRLTNIVKECQDLGLKVCIGEQCAEYLSFRRVHPDLTSRLFGSSHPCRRVRSRQR